MEQRTCHECQTPLTKKPGPGRWPRWCSECHSCRRSKPQDFCTVYFPTCALCSATFAARRSDGQYCSTLCKSRAYNAARKSDGRLALHNAESRRRWLEKVKKEHGSLRRAYPIAFQALDERRAKRVIAATTGGRFTHRQVFERDHWTCQLCHQPISQTLAWPDPMSASLDHVIPLACGGAHSLANAQASHLVCNQRKHTKVA